MSTETTVPTHDHSPHSWVEKQSARVLEALALDADGLLFDRDVRDHILRSQPEDGGGGEALAALRLASHAFRTAMNRWLENHGLSEGRLTVLWQLHGQDGRTLSDLATALDVSPRNVTGLVDGLEADGLVERRPDPDDRRATLVRLTDAGTQKLIAVRNDKDRARTTLIAGFSDEELAMFRHLCLKLVRNLAGGAGMQGREI